MELMVDLSKLERDMCVKQYGYSIQPSWKVEISENIKFPVTKF